VNFLRLYFLRSFKPSKPDLTQYGKVISGLCKNVHNVISIWGIKQVFTPHFKELFLQNQNNVCGTQFAVVKILRAYSDTQRTRKAFSCVVVFGDDLSVSVQQ
jgi:hypothetical protein